MAAGEPLDQQLESLMEKNVRERLEEIAASAVVIPPFAIESVKHALRTSFLSGSSIITSCLIKYDGQLTAHEFNKAVLKVAADHNMGTKRAGD